MPKLIFDNSNLAESYSGVTTPLTYSFARHVYQEVYQHFCLMMGVRKKIIKQNQPMFERMVEFIGYRMYYNLINWYKLISFLPGYKFNREFLEKMLGVQESYDYQKETKGNIFYKYLIDLPHLIWQLLKMGASFAWMEYLIKRFNKNFDKIFRQADLIKLEKLNLSALESLYFELMRKLVSGWRVPIANDLAVMISAGIADKLSQQWLKESIYAHLQLGSHGSLISLDPGLEIIKISRSLKKNPAIQNLFFNNDDYPAILAALKNEYSHSETASLLFQYLKKFGSRMPNELKLEAKTINEEPAALIMMIKNLARSQKFAGQNFSLKKADNKRYNNLGLLKKIIIKRMAQWAANSIYRREETRFRRALIFGYARKIFLAVGNKLAEKNLLPDARDIFYLTTEQIFTRLKSGKDKQAVISLIEERKHQFQAWQKIDLPRRIETAKSILALEQELKSRGQSLPAAASAKTVRGTIAARAGQENISGTALVLAEFQPAADFSDKILITKQTDPGWTIVFPLLKGLVVERGGMLSHAAILARELDIPCIIGAENATQIISNGAQVNLNLITGEISYATP